MSFFSRYFTWLEYKKEILGGPNEKLQKDQKIGKSKDFQN